MNPAQMLAIAAIRCYQLFLAPMCGGRCRFHPSCSQYALEAVRAHGAMWGVRLAMMRILRCHPWGGHGFDPVPVSTKKDII